MSRKTIRYMGLGLGALAGLFAVCVLGFVLLLMRGPIAVGFMNSYAEQAVQAALTSGDNEITVKIDQSVLAWDSQGRGVDFRAVNAVLYGGDGEALFEIPQISIGLSGWALLRGRLAPAELEMSGARLRMYRGANGGFAFGIGGVRPVSTATNEAPFDQVLRDFIDSAERNPTSRYLRSVSISQTSFEYQDPDRGRIFMADDVTISFERDGDQLSADAALSIAVGSLVATVDLTANVADNGGLDISLTMQNLPPALLGQIEPGLAAFGHLHVPISGTIEAHLGTSSTIESISFALQGNQGWIAAPELASEPMQVSFADLRGRIEDDFRLYTLEDFHFNFDGATTDISGIVFVDDGTVSTQLDVKGAGLLIEEIVKFVPMGEPKSITRWVKEHVFSGVIDELDVRLSATVPLEDGDITLESLNGHFAFSNATGKYLKAMTPMVELAGTGVLNNRSISVQGTNGRFENTSVVVQSGILEIADFSAPDSRAELRATMTGPANEGFAIINEEPLRLLRAMNIDPATAGGTATTDLSLSIPVRGQVGLGFIGYEADTNLANFSLSGDAFGRPIENANLTLALNKDQMVTEGTLEYGGLPVSVSWTRLFGEGRSYKSRYSFSGRLGARERRVLGMQFAPYLTGPIGFDLTFTKPVSGLGFGLADLNLTDTGLQFPSIQFDKQPGVAGTSGFEFVLGTDGVIAVSGATLEAGSLFAQGSMSLNARDPQFLPLRVTLNRVAHGDTDISGSLDIERSANAAGNSTPSVELFVVGDRLDLRGAFSGVLDVKQGGIGFPLRIVVGDPEPIGEVKISDTASLRNVVALVEHDGTVWRNVRSVGDLSSRALLNINLADQGDHRRLTLTSGDAGTALRSVGWFETIDGGTLNVTAILPNPPTDQAVVGQAVIEDFDLVGAPLMARLLTLASLKGLTQGAGEDLEFEELTLDFRLFDDFIEFPSAEAKGDVVIIAQGTLNRSNKQIDISGEVAPATTVNRLMGLTSLPVIGQIFGDSVFAASFRAKGSARDPELTVNPLSILTPGVMRRVLEVFSGGPAELPSRSGRPEQQATQPTP